MSRYLLILVLVVCAREATAVNVVIDYSLDTSNFFSASSPDGQKARETVEFAAAYLSELLVDNLSSIESPPDFVATLPPQFGSQTSTIDWEWTARFFDPSTGNSRDLTDLVIPENEYRLYVGARQLGTSTLGVAGPGVGFRSNGIPGFVDGSGQPIPFVEQSQLDAVQADFEGRLDNRLQASGDFGSWGGSAAFDIDATWNLDYRVQPQRGENDFLSVVLHEFVHTLGFGIVDEYQALISGGDFTGANAVAANGGAPALESNGGHFLSTTQSTIFGTSIQQEALLDPAITVGTRKLLTELDIAVLADIGWDVSLPGDYNGDGLVNTSDYAVWRDSLTTPNVIGNYDVWSESVGSLLSNTFLASSGVVAPIPEPASATALLALASLVAGARRRG